MILFVYAVFREWEKVFRRPGEGDHMGKYQTFFLKKLSIICTFAIPDQITFFKFFFIYI